MIGSVIGAQLAVDLDEALLRRIIGVLMLLMIAVMFIQPERWLERAPGAAASTALGRSAAVLRDRHLRRILAGGRRIFLIAALVLSAGFNLVTANAVKNLMVLVFTAAALVVFIVHDQVDWTLGLLLAAGQSLGAWLAARMAVKRGAKFVRWVVIVVIVISAAALLGGIG